MSCLFAVTTDLPDVEGLAQPALDGVEAAHQLDDDIDAWS